MFLQGRPPFFQQIANMKKTVIFGILMSALCLLSVSSCREKQLLNVRGEVKSVEIHKDTLIALTLSLNNGGDSLVFNLDNARFQNGVMLPKDSVIVDYIEHHDTLKALVVTVLPKVNNFSLPDTLVTISRKATDNESSQSKGK